MYVSNQLLRVHHDDWLRYAETRRQIKQAAAASSSQTPVRAPRRWRVGRRAPRLAAS